MSKITQECIFCEDAFQIGLVWKGKLICMSCAAGIVRRDKYVNQETERRD